MPATAKLLVILHLLLGIGAIGGGAVLIVDPNGGIMHMPTTVIAGSPFQNFLIPGLILFTVIGVGPVITALGLVKQPRWLALAKLNFLQDLHWSWAYSLYVGFALIIWITVEAFFLHQMALVHVAYIFLGLAIEAVTLLPAVQGYCRQR